MFFSKRNGLRERRVSQTHRNGQSVKDNKNDKKQLALVSSFPENYITFTTETSVQIRFTIKNMKNTSVTINNVNYWIGNDLRVVPKGQCFYPLLLSTVSSRKFVIPIEGVAFSTCTLPLAFVVPIAIEYECRGEFKSFCFIITHLKKSKVGERYSYLVNDYSQLEMEIVRSTMRAATSPSRNRPVQIYRNEKTQNASSRLQITATFPGEWIRVDDKMLTLVVTIANTTDHEISILDVDCLDSNQKKMSDLVETSELPVIVPPCSERPLKVRIREATLQLLDLGLWKLMAPVVILYTHGKKNRRCRFVATFQENELPSKILSDLLVLDISRTFGATSALISDDDDEEEVHLAPEMRGPGSALKQEKFDLEELDFRRLTSIVKNNLKNSSSYSSKEQILYNQVSGILRNELNEHSYVRRFECLVDIEEIQESIDLEEHSSNGVLLKVVSSTELRYQVKKQLTEDDSVIRIGDKIQVKPVCSDGFKQGWYQGRITDIQRDSVLLNFKPQFHEAYERRPNCKVNVKLEHKRWYTIPVRRALSLVTELRMEPFLFPSVDNIPKLTAPEPRSSLLNGFSSLSLYDYLNEQPRSLTQKPETEEKKITTLKYCNDGVAKNAEQMQAVMNIVNKTAMPFPYVLFGPPGTGKTVTLVEAIIQNWLYKFDDDDDDDDENDSSLYLTPRLVRRRKQLVCASSNSAADILAERLLETMSNLPDFKPMHDVYRMYAPSIKQDRMSLKIIKYKGSHNLDEVMGQATMPTLSVIMDKAIVVTTISNAGKLIGARINRSHFSHVYIDEAGHTTEPECLVPIIGMVTDYRRVNGQVVLAGDPHQLGPIVPAVVKNYDYDKSLLARFIEMEFYKNDKEGKYITKLVRNFRSHPAILDLPNKLFYNNELKADGSKDRVNVFCEWSQLPTRGFPILFEGVYGEEEQEDSPSYFNMAEVDRVCHYLSQLIGKVVGDQYISAKDIGIISPYRKQVSKLKEALKNMGTIDVQKLVLGSVDKFQGDERPIIILTTVRSPKQNQAPDIGFLAQKERFNVALTRAQGLLIIVGNPRVLSIDKYWGQLLAYCQENGGYKSETTTVASAPVRPLNNGENDDDISKLIEKLESIL